MGVKITVGSGEQHPEGWYAFKILDSEVATGKFGTQIKFQFKSSQKDEGGQAFKLTYFTSTVCNPTTKLGGLLRACGLPLEVGAELETDILEGQVIEGRVEHKETDKGTFANIVEVRARSAANLKPAPKPAPKPAEGDGFNDPFADE